MRVKFRIVPRRGEEKLKRDFECEDTNLKKGIRYIIEFKYLEATKWLMLAEDSFEKYCLLYLIYRALGQTESSEDFYTKALQSPKRTDINILTEDPGKGWDFEIKDRGDLIVWHTKML